VAVDPGNTRTQLRRAPGTTVAWLLTVILVTWLITIERMRGMDGGPGTDLGGFVAFVGVWATMMAAMMLPSVAPMVLLVDRLSQEKDTRAWGRSIPVAFTAAYITVWVLVGAIAYGLDRVVSTVDTGALAWDRAGPYVAGVVVVAAGVYQLGPLKTVCLRHCRSPLHFMRRHWRPGAMGTVRLGLAHGLYCVGCCVGLMVLLFALGVMSLVWMTLVAVVILAEKLLPYGEQASRALGLALIALGLWIAVAPGTVPGLTDPSTTPMPGMG
jgi:predicted metal-binding membrane protein